jgi:hypothetical protein
MKPQTITLACLLLLAAAAFPARSQTGDLDVDKMRADAQSAQKKSQSWYDIVDVKKNADTFEIIYNITGSQEDEYEVSLALVRDSDPAFRVVPRQATGKIGTGAFAGRNNSIVWNYKKDMQKEPKGNDYRFDLTVRKVEHGSFPWFWVGMGTAAGGAAAVLLLSKKTDETPSQTTMTIPAISISRPN